MGCYYARCLPPSWGNGREKSCKRALDLLKGDVSWWIWLSGLWGQSSVVWGCRVSPHGHGWRLFLIVITNCNSTWAAHGLITLKIKHVPSRWCCSHLPFVSRVVAFCGRPAVKHCDCRFLIFATVVRCIHPSPVNWHVPLMRVTELLDLS